MSGKICHISTGIFGVFNDVFFDDATDAAGEKDSIKPKPL